MVSAGFIAYVIAPASTLPLFAAAFGVDKPTASAAISAVFLAWAVFQIPAGFVLDRSDNRRLVAAGTAGFVLAGLAGLLDVSYGTFLLTRVASGGAIALVFVGSVNVLNRVLPADRRALGVSLFIASPPLGVAVGQFSGPLIAGPFGWRAPLLVYTLVALVGLGVFLVALRRPVGAADRVTPAQFVAALRNGPVLLVSAASFCTYVVWTFLNTWMPTYGTEVLGIDLAAAGAAAALVPLAGIVARPAGGWLSARIGGRLVPVIVASFLATTVLLVLLSRAPAPTAFAILLALTGGAVNLSVGLYLVYVHGLADAATQGTSLAVLATVSQVGNLVAPVAGGWFIDRFSWTAGFGFAAALAVAGLVAVTLVPITARRSGRGAPPYA